MELFKLRNSCICGNTIAYQNCCGRFAKALPQKNKEISGQSLDTAQGQDQDSELENGSEITFESAEKRQSLAQDR